MLITRQIYPGQASLIFQHEWQSNAYHAFDDGGVLTFWEWLEAQVSGMGWEKLIWGLDWLRAFAPHGQQEWEFSCELLTLLHDRRYAPGEKKRASLLALVDKRLIDIFNQAPTFVEDDEEGGQIALSPTSLALNRSRRLTWGTQHLLSSPEAGQSLLLIDGLGFPTEGDLSTARWMARSVESGWRRLLVYNWRGGRFAACGLGPNSDGIRVDLYGDVGDYAASVLAALAIYMAAFVTYHISLSEMFDRRQKNLIVGFVWIVPLVGPALIVAALSEDMGKRKKGRVVTRVSILVRNIGGYAWREYGSRPCGNRRGTSQRRLN